MSGCVNAYTNATWPPMTHERPSLTSDFFSDALVSKAILVTAQCVDSIIRTRGTVSPESTRPGVKCSSNWTPTHLREIPCASKGLEEVDIQNLYTTPPEQLTDEELLLNTFCVNDHQRKSYTVWEKQHPKYLFCRKPYRYSTFQVQYHMTYKDTWESSPSLTFDFFRDTLFIKDILVTVQCADSIITFVDSNSQDTLLPKRSTWTQKILPQTDVRL